MTPKTQAKTLDDLVIGIIEHAESYKENNDMSILRSGNLTKWFVPEATKAITQAMLDALPKKKSIYPDIPDEQAGIVMGFNDCRDQMESAIKLKGGE